MNHRYMTRCLLAGWGVVAYLLGRTGFSGLIGYGLAASPAIGLATDA